MLLRGKNLARHSLIRIKEIHIIRINSKNNFNQVFRILIKFQFNKTNVAVSRLFSKLIITSLRLLKNVTNFTQHRCNEMLKRIAGARIIRLAHSKRVDSNCEKPYTDRGHCVCHRRRTFATLLYCNNVQHQKGLRFPLDRNSTCGAVTNGRRQAFEIFQLFWLFYSNGPKRK